MVCCHLRYSACSLVIGRLVTKELESFVSPLRAHDEIKAKRRTGAMRNSVCLATSVHCDLDLMCETTSTVIHKQKRNAPTCNG